MTNPSSESIVAISNLDTLSFDQFERDPDRDIVCVAPARAMVRREEEITLLRRVHKLEEVDASSACPVNSTHVTKIYQERGAATEARSVR